MRIDMKGRGKGIVDELDARGKHAVTFDDGSIVRTALVKGFTVLSTEFVQGHCNEVIADREAQLFEQRINFKLQKAAAKAAREAAAAAAEENGDEAEEEDGYDPDDEIMEIIGEFADDEEEYGADEDSKRRKRKAGKADKSDKKEKKEKEKKEKKKKRKKGKVSLHTPFSVGRLAPIE
jgi:hypothetical protein